MNINVSIWSLEPSPFIHHYWKCFNLLSYWSSLWLQWRAFTTRWSYGGTDKQSMENSRKKNNPHTYFISCECFFCVLQAGVCEGGAWDAAKAQTTCVLILDIYLCLFLLSYGLHGSNFCCDESEKKSLRISLQGERQRPSPPLFSQEGFSGPRGTG